jgi:hypothetical protein
MEHHGTNRLDANAVRRIGALFCEGYRLVSDSGCIN